jgi:hypothetical protein
MTSPVIFEHGNVRLVLSAERSIVGTLQLFGCEGEKEPIECPAILSWIPHNLEDGKDHAVQLPLSDLVLMHWNADTETLLLHLASGYTLFPMHFDGGAGLSPSGGSSEPSTDVNGSPTIHNGQPTYLTGPSIDLSGYSTIRSVSPTDLSGPSIDLNGPSTIRSEQPTVQDFMAIIDALLTVVPDPDGQRFHVQPNHIPLNVSRPLADFSSSLHNWLTHRVPSQVQSVLQQVHSYPVVVPSSTINDSPQ